MAFAMVTPPMKALSNNKSAIVDVSSGGALPVEPLFIHCLISSFTTFCS